MLNPISIMADQLGDYLSELYLQYFSHRNPEYASYISGRPALSSSASAIQTRCTTTLSTHSWSRWPGSRSFAAGSFRNP